MTVTPKDVWSASQYNKAMSLVYSDANTRPVLDLLAPQPGERILDMGCGTGELTLRLQEIVGENGIVVGVDASRDMVSWRAYDVWWCTNVGCSLRKLGRMVSKISLVAISKSS